MTQMTTADLTIVRALQELEMLKHDNTAMTMKVKRLQEESRLAKDNLNRALHEIQALKFKLDGERVM